MNTCTTYTIDTLPPDIRDKVLDRHRHINVEHLDWWDSTIEDWNDKLSELGYASVDIRFRGFWSQGDGASFTSDTVPSPEHDPAVIAAWTKLRNYAILLDMDYPDLDDIEYSGKVYRSGHHYVHENTVSVEWSWEFPSDAWEDYEEETALDDAWTAFEKSLDSYYENLDDEVVPDLCRRIYKDLQAEYEYQTSDEQVAAALADVEFDEEGGEL